MNRQSRSAGLVSVTFPCRRTLGVVSPVLLAPLGLDKSLGLVGVFFESLHGPLHLPLLGGHRAQSPSNRELCANLVVVNGESVDALGHRVNHRACYLSWNPAFPT